MGNDLDYIGYLEYCGDLVTDGILDTRKTARALLGFDAALRHLVGLECGELKDLDYDIPVSIRPGSWQALIPSSIEQWIFTALSLIAARYTLTAVTEIAKNDFKDVNTKKLFAGAFRALQYIIRIGKHLGTIRQRHFSPVKWRNDNTEIGIPNSNGEYLFIPKHMLDIYSETSPRILSDMASLIEPDRNLRVVVRLEDRLETEGIDFGYKSIFYIPEEESDIILPELQHGQVVKLEGVVSRENENTNSLGLKYEDHILNCFPREGSIIRFKKALFLKCRIHGTISRSDHLGNVNKKKPTVIIDTIELLEKELPELSYSEE